MADLLAIEDNILKLAGKVESRRKFIRQAAAIRKRGNTITEDAVIMFSGTNGNGKRVGEMDFNYQVSITPGILREVIALIADHFEASAAELSDALLSATP